MCIIVFDYNFQRSYYNYIRTLILFLCFSKILRATVILLNYYRIKLIYNNYVLYDSCFE